jgi:spore coat polysaccharide biosynthesis protein SpsF
MKIGVLITARLKSTRLPRKALKPILGRPLIGHLVDRLRLARAPSLIAVCTSPLEEDSPLADFAAESGLACFRGDPDDVLARLTGAAQAFGLDLVVSCTADNPFVDPAWADRAVAHHVANGLDFTRIAGLPFGAFSYVLTASAMAEACRIKDEIDTEVWGGYFTQTGRFRCGVLEVDDPAVRWPELRLTVDTPEDFALAERIFRELHREGEVFPLAEIVALCRRRPELVALNSAVVQKAGKPIRVKAGA